MNMMGEYIAGHKPHKVIITVANMYVIWYFVNNSSWLVAQSYIFVWKPNLCGLIIFIKFYNHKILQSTFQY